VFFLQNQTMSDAVQQLPVQDFNGDAHSEGRMDHPPKLMCLKGGLMMHRGTDREAIGESAAFKAASEQVNVVAPTTCAVLIQGETGTGKELIARAIHERSQRSGGPFVTVNCAAIPAGLLESELFGHERGAFTGAVCSRIGRFQSAHKGTLFLDEIGEMPLELQPKLLRALQEQEFERLGSLHSVRVDVRIVAATNQNLTQMVRERRFRADLYYRLNVFPVIVPALRDRSEDIPLLVEHFVQVYAERQGKSIRYMPNNVMQALMNYHWPGNIRELQNFIERGVTMTRGEVLRLPLSGLAFEDCGAEQVRTLADAERAHIMATLRATNWVVGGPAGAAARLGLPRTTLIFKMRQLGIVRPELSRQANQGDQPFILAPAKDAQVPDGAYTNDQACGYVVSGFADGSPVSGEGPTNFARLTGSARMNAAIL